MLEHQTLLSPLSFGKAPFEWVGVRSLKQGMPVIYQYLVALFRELDFLKLLRKPGGGGGVIKGTDERGIVMHIYMT